MDRDHDIVDLGAASVETQGISPGFGDEVRGLAMAGLSDE